MFEEPDGIGRLKKLLLVILWMFILSLISAISIVYVLYKYGYPS